MSLENGNGKRLNGITAAVEKVYIPEEDDGFMCHLGLSKTEDDLEAMFGDTKFVCTGGSAGRLHNYAKQFSAKTGFPLSENLCRTDRYCMWKTGPVIWINHGIGCPSLLIMLHELFKVLHYAGAKGFKCIRMGTSGGVGISPGTVIVSTGAMNAKLEQKFTHIVGGKEVKHEAVLDKSMSEQLFSIAKEHGVPVEQGFTLCSDDFFEGQMRLDGFFCDYDHAEKIEFLKRAKSLGVKNIEMESAGFAAFTKRAKVPAAIACVVVLDRFKGDQIRLSKSNYELFESRLFEIVFSYILSNISIYKNGYTSFSNHN